MMAADEPQTQPPAFRQGYTFAVLEADGEVISAADKEEDAT